MKGCTLNPKILIGAIVVIIIVLAAPLLLNANRSAAPVPAAAPAAPAAPALPPPPPPPPADAAAAPAPIDYPVVYAPPPRTIPQYEQQQIASGPPLTAETLVGTAWEVTTPQGSVAIEIGPNGQATASHPLVGAIPGKWSVNGNKVTASASFMGQSMSIQAEIQGSTLKVPGQNIRRLR